jgi:octaprenyl-diphosphate synthase
MNPVTAIPTALHPTAEPSARPELSSIYGLIDVDMRAVNATIQHRLSSDVALVNQLSGYIVNSGGKRIRPILLLLCAHALRYTGQHHISLAAVIEFIHTATLLHDDVVDASALRRGRDTANAIWGNEASVLVGDFLYSRAFQMMVEVGNMRVLEILADATNTIAEGEVMQLMNCGDPDTTEANYLNVIRCKTAKLFEAAARIGGVISGCSRDQEKALALYGMHLGTAFQLIDDVLDYSGTTPDIGKNIGDDLAEGKPTLPLIRAMLCGSPDEAALIRRAIETGSRDNIAAVTRTVESTGALAYTARTAQDEADSAIATLADFPDSPYLEALRYLALFAVHRSY